MVPDMTEKNTVASDEMNEAAELRENAEKINRY